MAYPGMFTYKSLLKLKKRDFELWAWRAQKLLVGKEISEVNAIRIAHSDDAYKEFLGERKATMLRLEGKLEQHYKNAWEDFRIRKKG